MATRPASSITPASPTVTRCSRRGGSSSRRSKRSSPARRSPTIITSMPRAVSALGCARSTPAAAAAPRAGARCSSRSGAGAAARPRPGPQNGAPSARTPLPALAGRARLIDEKDASMPELPELEVVREVLARRLAGRRIDAVTLAPRGGPIVVRDLTGQGFARVLTGLTLESAARRGKFLLLTLPGSPYLLAVNPKLTRRLPLSAP